MRFRTLLSIVLLTAAVAVAGSTLLLNRELLGEAFHLNPETSIPVYAVLLAVFLAGFLPILAVLIVQGLKRDLQLRRERRRNREAESLDSRFRRAVDLHLDGQLSKSAAELEVLQTERPEDFSTLLRCGEVLRLQGKTEQALEVHRRASVLYPQSVALLYELSEDYEALGDLEAAREYRNRILRDFPDHGLAVLRRRRDAAMAAEDWDDAVRGQDRIAQLLKEGDEGDLLEQDAGIELGLSYQRGLALLEKDRAEDAAVIFRRLLEQEPRFVPAGIMLGEAELLGDNEDAAIDEWRRGFKTTGSPVFLQRIEDYFIETSEPARAIESLRSLIASADNDLMLRFFLGRLYYRIEMHDDALKVLESIGERMDASPSYHYLIGRIRQRRNDQRGAMARFLACLQRLGLPKAVFACKSCNTTFPEWQDRCPVCGTWNAVDIDIGQEQLSAEELGVVERPVWGGYTSSVEEAMVETPAKTPSGDG